MNYPTRILLAVTLAAFCHTTAAQVPQIINYQGRINVGSSPFTGTGQFRFALVNGDATTSFWSNDGTSTAGSAPTAAVSLPVANGLYVVPLGDTAIPNMQAVPASVFTNNDVRLRVWFDDGTNGSQMLAPDQRITSVGYAMVAGTVPDGAITSAKLAPAAVGSSNLVPGMVINGTVTGPIGWSQLSGVPAGLADGTDDLGVWSITAGSGLVGGTITGTGTIALSSDVPRLGAGLNAFSGSLLASSIAGDGSGLTNLSGFALQNGSVPIAALQSAARPKYDRQTIAITGNEPTLNPNGIYVDLSGLTLVAKNLGESGTYFLSFKSSIRSLYVGGGGYYFAVNVNGTDVEASRVYVSPSNTSYQFVSTSVAVGGINAGDTIKIRCNISGSQAQLYRPSLTIDGVPTSQVIP
jgi:hypothetical protein